MQKIGSAVSEPSHGGRRVVLAAMVALVTGLSCAAEPATKTCQEHPQVRGQCFSVYGRVRLYSDPPAVRIWVQRTNSWLGVGEGQYVVPGYANLPPELAKLVKLNMNVWGDFRVCPFEPDRPGTLRLVCVQSVSKIRVGPITQPTQPTRPPANGGA